MQKLFQTGMIAICLSSPALAQRSVSDAKITYKVELPQEQLQMESMFAGSSMTQYIRGDMSRIDMNLNVVNYVYIINTKKESVVTLLDNHGDKYLIRSDRKAYAEDYRKYEAVQFIDQDETREIAGYTCRKAIGKMPDGSTFDVFYTTGLVAENRAYNRRFMNLKGIPLEFEIVMKAGAKMRAVATDVDLSPQPASIFDIPKGYREITQEELKKIRG